MQFLGMKHYIHRDLACRNCLLSENMTVKISDLGLAIQANIHEIHSDERIPFRWTALEALTQMEYSIESDVWSFGLCLWEIMMNCEFIPFRDVGDKLQLIERINERMTKGSPIIEKPEDCPDALFDIMQQCWKKSPNERPNFKALVNSLQSLQLRTEKAEETNQDEAEPDIETTEDIPISNTGICDD